jgi:hypothetical protein
MIIGFARRGKGDGHGVVGYITDGADAVGYVAGGKKAGKRRDPAPVVLRGDPKVARHLIDLVPHRWRYTSGMISFAPGERITPETEQRVMDEFERCSFAGLRRERFYTLWVRHQDGSGGCHHLHLVTPRMELFTGKSLNIAPPGKASRELFDTLRSKLNAELGLSDPDDPSRIQAVRLPHHVAKAKARERNGHGQAREDARVLVTRHLEEKAREGVLKDRDGVARYLRESGFDITREGDGYLTVRNQDTGERARLRGGLYDREKSRRVIAGLRDGKQEAERRNPERLRELEAKLERLVAARAEHNLKRYGPNHEPVQSKERCHDRFGKGIAGRGSRDGTLVCRTRRETQRTLDRLGEGTRRFERATRNLVEPGRLLDRAIERGRAQQRERAIDRSLIDKCGARETARSNSRERGFEREMEMEREFV